MRFVLLFCLLISVLPSRAQTTQDKLEAIKKYRKDIAHTINTAEQKASLNNFRGQTNQNINTSKLSQYSLDFMTETSGDFNYTKYNDAYKKYKARVNSAINTSAQSKSRNSFNLSFFNKAETQQLQQAKNDYLSRSGTSPEGWKMRQAHEEFKIKANKAYDMEKFDKKYTQLESAADKAKDLKRFSDARQSFLDSTGTAEDEARFKAARDEFTEISNTSTEDLVQKKKDMMDEGGAFDQEESEIDEAKTAQDELDAEAQKEEEEQKENQKQENDPALVGIKSFTFETDFLPESSDTNQFTTGVITKFTSDSNVRWTLKAGESRKIYMKDYVYEDGELKDVRDSETDSTISVTDIGNGSYFVFGVGAGGVVTAATSLPYELGGIIRKSGSGHTHCYLVDFNGQQGLEDFGNPDGRGGDNSGGGGDNSGGGGDPGGGDNSGGEEGEEGQDPNAPTNAADTASEFPALDRFLACLDKFTFGDVGKQEISFEIMNTTISTENGLSSMILSASRAFSVFVISVFLGLQIFTTLRQW